MHSFKKFFDKQLIHFIINFILADIAIIIATMMSTWVLYEKIGIKFVTLITLATLFINTVFTKKFSPLLDKYSRTKVIVIINIIMCAFIGIALLSNLVCSYALINLFTSLYFGIFFLARGAVAQAMTIKLQTFTFKSLNVLLAIIDRIGAILVSVLISFLFKKIGADSLMFLAFILLMISTLLFIAFEEPLKPSANQSQTKLEKRDFAWFFNQNHSFLLIISTIITVLVLSKNTIDTVYLYDIIKLSPDDLAKISISFNFFALIGGVLANYFTSEKTMIYVCFAVGIITSLIIVATPTYIGFFITTSIIGFINSVNRVASGSLVMQTMPNNQIATFNGFINTINLSLQFFLLLLINLFLFSVQYFNKNDLISYVIWFYPFIFMSFVLVWIFKKMVNKIT